MRFFSRSPKGKFKASVRAASVIRGAGFDESLYVAGTLSYELTDLKFSYLRQIFVTVAHGRQPPATKDATTVFVGLVIGPKLRAHTPAPNL